MDFIKLCNEAHAMAVEKGWWEQERSELEIIALIHSEVSEAVEECCSGHLPVYWLWKDEYNGDIIDVKEGYSENKSIKPEGELIELADACIRIFDWIGSSDELIQKNELSEYERQTYHAEGEFLHLKPIEFYGYLHCSLPIYRGRLVKFIEKWCAAHGWNLEEAIERKMAYNATRPERHGGKLH